MKIVIDKEFRDLIPALSDEERQGLEESLLNEGCRDSLVLWGDILIDGHNRYEICNKYHIPYETVQREFASRNDVISWIILNQFGRRNLPAHERARLALRLKPVIAERAKEKQLAGLKQNNTVSQKSVERVDTQKELAKIAGVSHDTIAKVEHIEKEAPEPIVNASRNNDISINMAHQVTKMCDEEKHEIAERIEQGEKAKVVIQEVQKRPHVSYNSGNNEWYTPLEYIEAARKAMGSIDLDPASSEIANQIVKAKTYYTVETNGLDKTWKGNVWLNPPYASDLISKFVDKLVSECDNYSQAIVLVNNATETEWFNKIVNLSSVVCFPRSRVKFYKPDGSTGAPLQGQAVLYIGSHSKNFIENFSSFGWCAYI